MEKPNAPRLEFNICSGFASIDFFLACMVARMCALIMALL